jgi:hypothetical protein
MAEPRHNTNALLVGTVEFFFSEGATTRAVAESGAGGWLSLGNVVSVTPNVSYEQQEHKGSYRGKKRTDKTITTESTLDFSLVLDEWKVENMANLFGASDGTAFTQGAQAAANGDDIVFTGGAPSDDSLWYGLMVSGSRIRNLTTLTIATLTEGTDFEVDTLLGRVRFLVQQTATLTPVLTADAITSSDDGYFAGLLPLGQPTRSGYGNLVAFDQYSGNKIPWDYEYFQCDISADSAGAINGTDVSEITLTITVTQDVGNMLVRAANAV